jgi:anhydro-N-acetylmuramic acid kinase
MSFLLNSLYKKRTKLVVGLMSGTSADSIDAVLVSVTGSGIGTKFKQIEFISVSYPKGYSEYLLSNSLPGFGSVDTISTLNILAAEFFADAVKKLAHKARVPLSSIDLIGSHGQTVHHMPEVRKVFGKKTRSTLQIGDPATIAKLTGIVTVGDFRTGDMALGGEGAPLVPYFDYIAFRSKTKNRILLNIGGIANITWLKKNCSLADVAAFDTGPGNMIVDALMKRLYHTQFDKGGRIALRGEILLDIIVDLLRHPYFKRRPPKSTGRELFGKIYVENILRNCSGARHEDVVATLTEFTPLTVFQQFTRFVGPSSKVDELIVSGGGSHNVAMMDALQRYFAPASVLMSRDAGVSADAKEAICFALLANETISGNPSNVPRVTGASRPAILGKICLP